MKTNMTMFVLNDSLLPKPQIDHRWQNSPLLSLKMLLPKQKGKQFELITQEILRQMGEKVSGRTNSEHDCHINGESCELKGSTTTMGKDDVYSFLQIRPDQDYQNLVLTTFCFDGTISIFRIPKDDVLTLIQDGVFKKQHGGNKANSRTFSYNGTTKRFEKYLWHRGQYKPQTPSKAVA